MGLIAWIILGGLAGWIGGMLTHTKHGLFLNIFVGIVGAVLGGLIVSLFGGAGITGFNIYSLAVAIFGSVVFIGIVTLLTH